MFVTSYSNVYDFQNAAVNGPFQNHFRMVLLLQYECELLRHDFIDGCCGSDFYLRFYFIAWRPRNTEINSAQAGPGIWIFMVLNKALFRSTKKGGLDSENSESDT